MKDKMLTSIADKIYSSDKELFNFLDEYKATFFKREFSRINEYFIKHKKYKNLTPSDKGLIRILPIEVVPYFDHSTESWSGTTSSFALEIKPP